MKISVIVPVYNVEKYLDKCVTSIINQSYTNMEIILVDDGATDLSGKMCDEWAKKDNRIKVIHKENGGLSDARNVGIDNATGDYIAFVDSDDYVHEDMYKNIIELMQENDCDMGICNYVFVDEEGKEVCPISDTIQDEILSREEIFDKLMVDENFYYVTAWNKVYKREIFKDIRFPKGKIHEDEYSAHHILGKASKIVTTKDVYVYYVQRQGSIMNTAINIKKINQSWAFLDRYEYFKKIGRKENEKYALRQSYSVALTCINGLELKKNNSSNNQDEIQTNREEIKKLLKVLIRKLKWNLRIIKLLIAYIRNF